MTTWYDDYTEQDEVEDSRTYRVIAYDGSIHLIPAISEAHAYAIAEAKGISRPREVTEIPPALGRRRRKELGLVNAR